MKRRGRKTTEWERIRAELKPRFEAVGITSCELRRSGCGGDFILSFAHPKKRRFLSREELYVCALSCANCHGAIEKMSHKDMEYIVMTAINSRKAQP